MITFRRAAWDFLRGLKVMEKVDKNGVVPYDAMSYEHFDAAVAKLAHIENEREAVIDVIANPELMARLESLAREIVECDYPPCMGCGGPDDHNGKCVE